MHANPRGLFRPPPLRPEQEERKVNHELVGMFHDLRRHNPHVSDRHWRQIVEQATDDGDEDELEDELDDELDDEDDELDDDELDELEHDLRRRRSRREQWINSEPTRRAIQRSTPRHVRHGGRHVTINVGGRAHYAAERPYTPAERVEALSHYGELGHRAIALLQEREPATFAEIRPRPPKRPVDGYGTRYAPERRYTEQELERVLQNMGPIGRKALELKKQRRRGEGQSAGRPLA
jgi:hypothetical protein